MTGERKFRIGTSEKGGTFWTQGIALAALLERDEKLPVTVLDAERASIENGARLEDDVIDAGFMASNWIGRAYRGEPPFEKPLSLRVVAPVNSGAMFFIVRTDSALRSLRDLVGKRVAVGPEGSGMVQHVHAIFGALGLSFADIDPVFLSFEEGGRALRGGGIDAQWQCPYPNPVMREISERTEVRVLEMPEADLRAVLDRIDFYRRAVMPAGLFRGVSADTAQLAVVNILAAHERCDADAVRKIVSVLLRSGDELAGLNPLFRDLADLFEPLRRDGAAALEFGGVPLHPGALQACRDAGYL